MVPGSRVDLRPRARRPAPPSGRRDSNPRPSPWQGDALPTEPRPRARPLEGRPVIASRDWRACQNFSRSWPASKLARRHTASSLSYQPKACLADPAALTQPVFFISTHGPFDAVIASPATERAFYNSTTVHAALGIIRKSDGKKADHNSVANTADGGNPGGELGYATAWLEYQLRGDATAAGAFSGTHPELVSNTNWPGSAAK